MHQAMHGLADLWKLLVAVEDDQCMEVAIANVSDDRGLQIMRCEVFLGLVYKFGEPRDRNAWRDVSDDSISLIAKTRLTRHP